MTVDGWNDLFNSLGVLLVGATFVFGLGALITGRIINKRQTAEIVRLSTAFTAAQTDLSKQRERTATAEKDAAEAKSMAAAAGEGTLKALANVEEQRERAAKAEKELLELRVRVEPRELSAATIAKLADALRLAKPKGEVLIAAAVGDTESLMLARTLHLIFGSAGWPVTPSVGAMPTMVGFGLILFVRDPASAPPHAAAILQSLTSAGLDIAPEKNDQPAERVIVFVGTRR